MRCIGKMSRLFYCDNDIHSHLVPIGVGRVSSYPVTSNGTGASSKKACKVWACVFSPCVLESVIIKNSP